MERKPQILVIGAGSRGNAYSQPIHRLGLAEIAAVCEPDVFKRQIFGQRYIWGGETSEAEPTKIIAKDEPASEKPLGSGSIDTTGAGILNESAGAPQCWQEFDDWQMWIKYETVRRERVRTGELREPDPEARGVDAVIIACMDEMHVAVCKALAPFGLHILCEKPLATRLEDVVDIYRTYKRQWLKQGFETVFSICHVLRYSPHNMLLRKLVREDMVIGDVLSVEHTEPVGWWHFSHSYVRGNWRREDHTAPSLLTKSCHDVDFLLWLLASPTGTSSNQEQPHLPARVSSTGSRNLFRRKRKPKAAGNATNCFSCPIEKECIYSAKRIYIDQQFEKGNMGWPAKIVLPDIEDTVAKQGKDVARDNLISSLKEDYTAETPIEIRRGRNWFGRCVWECDNDVCDDQSVTISWDDADDPNDPASHNHLAKTARLLMTSSTEKICERRGHVYGTTGEISYDSSSITIHDFTDNSTRVVKPSQLAGDDGQGQAGHGGGDTGLAIQFVKAVKAAMGGDMTAEAAQRSFLGCSLEEVVRSHVAVFAAEESRVNHGGGPVDWQKWCQEHLDPL